MCIDGVGIILLAVGLTALQIFLERGEREQWFESTFIVVTAVVAGVTLVALVAWELYVEDPVINFRLLKNVPFTAGTCLGAIFGVTPYDVGTAQTLDGLTGRLAAANGLPPGVAEDSALKFLDGTVNQHATMIAYNDIFWLMVMIFVLGLPFLLLLVGSRNATPESG